MSARLDPKAIARRYGGNASGNQVNIPTDGHGKCDRGTSLTINPTAPDGVLVHVHNGGDPLAVKDMLRRDGFLPERESTATRNRPMFTKAPRQPGVSCFEYQDGDGVTVCRKVRTDKADGKTFAWQHPDGNGGWINGRGCDALFYRLPGLIAAPADAVIYIAEGERKADKLAGWGLVATSSKDVPDDMSALAGRRVVILPDNDDEGARIADKLQAALEGIAERVAVVHLPGLPHRGDIIDWGGTASELQALAAKALSGESDLLPTLDLDALAKIRAKPVAFAIERIAPLGEVTLFTGGGGTGKSLLTQQLVTAAAAGLSCLGLHLIKTASLYVTCEDAPDQLHYRQERLCEALGVDMASLAGKLHLASLRGALGNELAILDSKGSLSPSPAFHRLVATIKATGAKIVALDNVAHLFTGNENDRGQVTQFVNLLNRLAGETGAAILLIAHPNKSGDNYSGSTAWLNAVRSQVFIDRVRDGDGVVIDPDARVLSVGKANYGPSGDAVEFRWHNWAFVRPDDLPAGTRAELAQIVKANGENAAFMRCLDAATKARRAVSHNPGTNYAPKVFAAMPDGKGHSQKAFAGAMERLLHLGEIELDAALWQDAHRHWKQGIRAVEKCGNPPAATPCGDLRQPPAETGGNACGNPRAAPPLYTTYNKGAALDAAAPDIEEDPFDPTTWGTGK